mmetsp:Transcript_41106/g.124182  ORF Transcript_41106/g.124182 Transcript_41106/m.124182 type:complete len:358 (+) Transcript_41106:238-1311(+)
MCVCVCVCVGVFVEFYNLRRNIPGLHECVPLANGGSVGLAVDHAALIGLGQRIAIVPGIPPHAIPRQFGIALFLKANLNAGNGGDLSQSTFHPSVVVHLDVVAAAVLGAFHVDIEHLAPRLGAFHGVVHLGGHEALSSGNVPIASRESLALGRVGKALRAEVFLLAVLARSDAISVGRHPRGRAVCGCGRGRGRVYELAVRTASIAVGRQPASGVALLLGTRAAFLTTSDNWSVGSSTGVTSSTGSTGAALHGALALGHATVRPRPFAARSAAALSILARRPVVGDAAASVVVAQVNAAQLEFPLKDRRRRGAFLTSVPGAARRLGAVERLALLGRRGRGCDDDDDRAEEEAEGGYR